MRINVYCITIAVLLSVATMASAQPNWLWTQQIGGALYDCGYCVSQTSDGGFIITGKSEPLGSGFGDLYLVRTDDDGDTLWTRLYGGREGDCGYGVAETTDGGFIVTGVTNEGMYGLYGDLYVLKTDAGGDTIWTRSYNWGAIDRGNGVLQTEAGDYLIAGLYDGAFTAPEGDAFLMKLDPDGNTIWL
ncbi:MAG: hypothetical protein ABH878_10670, partial [bacterium]